MKEKRSVVDVLKNDVTILGKLITEFDRTCTTTHVAKKLFGNSIKSDYDLRKKDSFIREWFKRWEEEGIIQSTDVNGKKFYTPDISKIHWGEKATLKLKTGKASKTLKLGFTVALDIDGSCVAVTL